MRATKRLDACFKPGYAIQGEQGRKALDALLGRDIHLGLGLGIVRRRKRFRSAGRGDIRAATASCATIQRAHGLTGYRPPGIALIAGVLDEARKGARRPVLRIDSRGINA